METTPVSGGTYQAPLWARFILGRKPSWTVLRILFVVFVTFAIFKFILLPIRVTGHSMWPTYHNGEVKFVNRLAYLRDKPQRGDVVAVEYAGEGVVLLKRVVGLPGETFQVIQGDVYINGQPLEEPYAFGKIPAPEGALRPSHVVKMEPDQYILFGDNRPISEGFLKFENQIIGKIL